MEICFKVSKVTPFLWEVILWIISCVELILVSKGLQDVIHSRAGQFYYCAILRRTKYSISSSDFHCELTDKIQTANNRYYLSWSKSNNQYTHNVMVSLMKCSVAVHVLIMAVVTIRTLLKHLFLPVKRLEYKRLWDEWDKWVNECTFVIFARTWIVRLLWTINCVRRWTYVYVNEWSFIACLSLCGFEHCCGYWMFLELSPVRNPFPVQWTSVDACGYNCTFTAKYVWRLQTYYWWTEGVNLLL